MKNIWNYHSEISLMVYTYSKIKLFKNRVNKMTKSEEVNTRVPASSCRLFPKGNVEWTTKQGTEGGLQLTPRNQIPQSN
jgi:hypothetical protein